MLTVAKPAFTFPAFSVILLPLRAVWRHTSDACKTREKILYLLGNVTKYTEVAFKKIVEAKWLIFLFWKKIMLVFWSRRPQSTNATTGEDTEVPRRWLSLLAEGEAAKEAAEVRAPEEHSTHTDDTKIDAARVAFILDNHCYGKEKKQLLIGCRILTQELYCYIC